MTNLALGLNLMTQQHRPNPWVFQSVTNISDGGADPSAMPTDISNGGADAASMPTDLSVGPIFEREF